MKHSACIAIAILPSHVLVTCQCTKFNTGGIIEIFVNRYNQEEYLFQPCYKISFIITIHPNWYLGLKMPTFSVDMKFHCGRGWSQLSPLINLFLLFS